MWQENLLEWYEAEHRDLPWRKTKNPYFIWLSEVMLQQTRAETVKGYYERFLNRFPDIASLAKAQQQDVLKQWEGLGYYSRARNLQKAAQQILELYNGQFPQEYTQILNLPGIGAYTAGAVASIAFGIPSPAIDGNVYRVSSRFFGIREPIDRPSVQKTIRELITEAIPKDRPGLFNQAMMELGATLCGPNAPCCAGCPLQCDCDAYAGGDASSLPVHERKAPPRQIDMAVLLLTFRNKTLVIRREERLLKGMYVMYLLEGVKDRSSVERELKENGLKCNQWTFIGEARHVFTHRVWNMRLYHAELTEEPVEWLRLHSGAKLIDRSEMETLPIPTAMKAAKKAALDILCSLE